jgi:RimJ/RimL family protein N-acetyltransferase
MPAGVEDGRLVTLADGTELVVRPIRTDDKRELAAAFEQLGPESRYRRFLAAHSRLTRSELQYLTEVDHSTHEALVATVPGTGRGVGVARYVSDPQRPDSAELAVTVVDAWQGRGVGGLLLEALVERARSNGIRRFTASVLSSNAPMLALLDSLGDAHLTGQSDGVREYAVDLPARGVGALGPLLRFAAALT